jgi:hypothetical protein
MYGTNIVIGFVVSEAATDSTDAAFSVVVAVGGGSFKLARECSVCLEAVDADDLDVHANLAAAVFLLDEAVRLLFERGFAMLLSGMVVGIAGRWYYCEVLGCKIMGEWMVGSDLWLPMNPVVATAILWYKPQNSVDPTVLFLGTLSYRTGAHVGLCTK